MEGNVGLPPHPLFDVIENGAKEVVEHVVPELDDLPRQCLLLERMAGEPEVLTSNCVTDGSIPPHDLLTLQEGWSICSCRPVGSFQGGGRSSSNCIP